MDCQARWFYKYVLNLPDPKNSGLALGIAVHAALAFNFAQKIESGFHLAGWRGFFEALKMRSASYRNQIFESGAVFHGREFFYWQHAA